MTPRPLTATELRSLLSYDPETGVFTRLTGKHSGKPAGCLSKKGAVQVYVRGRIYLAHRLAWLYVTGEWPKNQIDHKDRNPANNVLDNLREATHAQNSQNTQRLKSKYGRGIRFMPGRRKKPWRVTVNADRKTVNVYACSLAEAKRLSVSLRQSLHGEFHPQ